MAVVAATVGFLTACSGTDPVRGDTTSARTPANYFRVGDCLQDPVTQGEPATIVDCAKPHAAEVYAIFALPDGPFPGTNKVIGYRKQCGAAARAIASDTGAGNDPSLKTIVRSPDEHSWALGDRSVTCIASSDHPRTGSIRG